MLEKNTKKWHSKTEAFSKALKFCTYQERSYKQVRQKIYDLGYFEDDADEMLMRLSRENFLNEERFAKAYASGKFRQNKWGRIKIKLGLKQEEISEYCIKNAMQEIDDEDYIKTILKLISQKWHLISEKNILVKKYKVVQFLQSKGFEKDIVIDNLNEFLNGSV